MVRPLFISIHNKNADGGWIYDQQFSILRALPAAKGKSGSTREFRWSSKDFNFIWIENFRVKPDDDNSFSIFITAMIDAISEHLQLLIQIFDRTFSVSTKID